ncbi:ferredoxin--nitrite reductase, partial [Halorubrum sp. Atlit-26R]
RYNARIKFLMDEWGAEKFRNVLQEEYVDFELETAGEDLRSEYSYNSGYADGGHSDHVGIHEQADGNYYVGLDVLVGRMGVDDTKELARVADEYGSGEIRITQRQNVIITDVPEEKLDALQNEDLLDHYSPDPHPFMRGSIACTGTEFCSLSIVETKNRQVRYARWPK